MFAYSILSPLGLSKVVAYFTPNQKKITHDQVYGYAGILVFLKVFNFWGMGNLHVWERIMGMRIQASVKSLLYRKALKLSPAAAGTSLGNIVTLVTKDTNNLESNMWMIKDFIIFIIEFCTVSVLLYNKLGNAAFVGLGLVFISVPLQGEKIRYRIFYAHSYSKVKKHEKYPCSSNLFSQVKENFFK